MFNSRYFLKNTNNLEEFQNKEIDFLSNKYFVKINSEFDIQHISKLIYQPINEHFYYSAQWYPSIDKTDFTKGSIYKDYVIPTAAYKFTIDNGCVSVDTNSEKISLTEYTDQIDQSVSNEINNIYKSHDHVVLTYSGGVDSMVLLSYIIAGGFLSQTTILTHQNFVQSPDHPSLISNSPARLQALEDVLDLTSGLGAKIIKISVDPIDLASALASKNFIHSSCYSATKALTYFNNTAFLFGHHGNQALLHKDIFIDQLLLNGILGELEVQQALDKKNYYVTSATDYDINRVRVPLEYCPLLLKQWPELTGYNNNTTYAPLGAKLKLCRDIDFRTVDLYDILDAKVARDLISKNVGTMLDKYIVTEGVGDGDAFVDRMFDRDQLDGSLLKIPNNINHNLTGYNWLTENLKRSNISGLNLLSLAALHHLSELHNKFGWQRTNY
jgi:hypothetical protein